MANRKEVARVVQVTRIRHLNWWGYSLELLIYVTPSNIEQIIHEVILPDETKLRLVVEEHQPICDHCGEKGHIRVKCPQNEKETRKIKNQISSRETAGRQTGG